MRQGVDGGGGSGGDVELGQDIRDVAADGVLAQGQLGGDLFIAPPAGQQRQHFHLAWTETVCTRGRVSRPTDLVREGLGPHNLRLCSILWSGLWPTSMLGSGPPVMV